MSLRNIRKLFGKSTLPPADNSDDEYVPLYTKASPSKFKYDVFVLSSHSESEHESTEAVPPEDTATNDGAKKKKKKKKQKRRKKAQRAGSSSCKENAEMDEIDKCVMEVNALLGTPPPHVPEVKPPVDIAHELFSVQTKHLVVTHEIKRFFGPEVLDKKDLGIRRGHKPNLYRAQRKAILVPVPEKGPYTKCGLTMSVDRKENGCTYFVFDHSREYQKYHHNYLDVFSFRLHNMVVDEGDNVHIEGLLQSADSMFRMENYNPANTFVEHAVAYMQHSAHPTFNLIDRNTRLEYRVQENRCFHVAVMKYMYMLTNRACHRTALELAKLLLNLDPSDPLALLFIIDTLALRSQEHEWLIRAIDYWAKERDARFMFNMQYSYALAHYQVALKNKTDTARADELLRSAMIRFPAVVVQILRNAHATSNLDLFSHPLFLTVPDGYTSRDMADLMNVYARFVGGQFAFREILPWFIKTAEQLAKDFDRDLNFQERVVKMAVQQYALFRGMPQPLYRHMIIIKPMSALLIDGGMPRLPRYRAFDPVPPADGLNRYGYDRAQAAARRRVNSALYEFVSSLAPQYNAAAAPRAALAALAAPAAPAAPAAGLHEPNEMQRWRPDRPQELPDLVLPFDYIDDDEFDPPDDNLVVEVIHPPRNEGQRTFLARFGLYENTVQLSQDEAAQIPEPEPQPNTAESDNATALLANIDQVNKAIRDLLDKCEARISPENAQDEQQNENDNQETINQDQETVDVDKETVDVDKETVDVDQETVHVDQETVHVDQKNVDVDQEEVDVDMQTLNVDQEKLDVDQQNVDVDQVNEDDKRIN